MTLLHEQSLCFVSHSLPIKEIQGPGKKKKKQTLNSSFNFVKYTKIESLN